MWTVKLGTINVGSERTVEQIFTINTTNEKMPGVQQNITPALH